MAPWVQIGPAVLQLIHISKDLMMVLMSKFFAGYSCVSDKFSGTMPTLVLVTVRLLSSDGRTSFIVEANREWIVRP